jgi:hypothetical protein
MEDTAPQRGYSWYASPSSFTSAVAHYLLHSASDQAFRTSPKVFLIFGANKQGRFYGWAMMRSTIASQTREARSISIGSISQMLSTPPCSNGALSSDMQEKSSGSNSKSDDDPLTTDLGRARVPHALLELFRRTTHSPAELSPDEEISYSSMPSPVGGSSSTPSVDELASVLDGEVRSTTLNPHALGWKREGGASDFKLYGSAPGGAAEKRRRSSEARALPTNTTDNDGIFHHNTVKPAPDQAAVVDDVSCASAAKRQAKVGCVFDVEWIKTGVLPFHQLKHLRNPWNRGNEVKASARWP